MVIRRRDKRRDVLTHPKANCTIKESGVNQLENLAKGEIKLLEQSDGTHMILRRRSLARIVKLIVNLEIGRTFSSFFGHPIGLEARPARVPEHCRLLDLGISLLNLFKLEDHTENDKRETV